MPKTVEKLDAIAQALARAAICRAIACALDYPTPERRADMHARWDALLRGAAGWPAGVRETADAVVARFGGARTDELEAAHIRLFGPAGRAPMVETAWGEAGRMLGRSAALADLGGFYRAFAVEPAAAHPRPEDHLAVELEFLSVLAIKEAWALGEGLSEALAVTRDATTAFLRDHLGTWVSAWRAAILDNEPPPAYAALADLVECFVRSECARVGVAPPPVTARAIDREAGADCFACPMATEV